MVCWKLPPEITTTGLFGVGLTGCVTFTSTVFVTVCPPAPVATQVYVVSVLGNTTAVGLGGRNWMPLIVTPVAPVVSQVRSTLVPGAGDVAGSAVKELIASEGGWFTVTVAVAVALPAAFVAVSV